MFRFLAIYIIVFSILPKRLRRNISSLFRLSSVVARIYTSEIFCSKCSDFLPSLKENEPCFATERLSCKLTLPVFSLFLFRLVGEQFKDIFEKF